MRTLVQVARRGEPMANTTKREEAQQGPPEHTQPAEVWGERVAKGRTIARGAKNGGAVSGAMDEAAKVEHANVVAPPAPPGESSPEAVQKTRAVAQALTRLGENADAARVAEAVKADAGIDID